MWGYCGKYTVVNKNLSEQLPKEILNDLKMLGESPEQVIERIFSRPLESPEARDVLAALLSGLHIHIGVNLPEWVVNASIRFLESSKLDFAAKTQAELTHKDAGKMVGLWESGKAAGGPQEIQKALATFCQILKTHVNDDPPEDAKDFHSGRIEAKNIIQATENLTQRAKIFMAIMLQWRKVSSFTSTTELWQWLLSIGDNGRKLIAPSTDSREIRTVCQLIGLRYKSRS